MPDFIRVQTFRSCTDVLNFVLVLPNWLETKYFKNCQAHCPFRAKKCLVTLLSLFFVCTRKSATILNHYTLSIYCFSFVFFSPISAISDEGFVAIRGKKFRYQIVYCSQNAFLPKLLANLFCTSGNSERNIWDFQEFSICELQTNSSAKLFTNSDFPKNSV